MVCICHCECGEVFNDGEVHTIGNEFISDFCCDGEQAVESGYGYCKVGVVLAFFCAVKYETFNF